MDTKAARTLKIGERVTYTGSPHPRGGDGTVIGKGRNGYRVRWDDGNETDHGFVHSDNIHRAR